MCPLPAATCGVRAGGSSSLTGLTSRPRMYRELCVCAPLSASRREQRHSLDTFGLCKLQKSETEPSTTRQNGPTWKTSCRASPLRLTRADMLTAHHRVVCECKMDAHHSDSKLTVNGCEGGRVPRRAHNPNLARWQEDRCDRFRVTMTAAGVSSGGVRERARV